MQRGSREQKTKNFPHIKPLSITHVARFISTISSIAEKICFWCKYEVVIEKIKLGQELFI